IAGAPIGSLKFLGSKEESMACALRRYGVTDSGFNHTIGLILSFTRPTVSPEQYFSNLIPSRNRHQLGTTA
ncbi:MAG: hypothetical protein P8X79_22970, partial [Reinekea sp.]